MIAAWAILVDSMRQLKSRSLFWLALAISALVALLLFGTISFNEQGLRILWFDTIDNEFVRAGSPGARDLMTWLFSGVFVFWWLTWGAIILAVISTSSMIPDFLASGSVELVLSRPIGRLRLFFLKVLGACLFVALQAGISILLAYLLLGWRYAIWEHAILWAVPLLVAQFLYVFAPGAVVAVLTRSTLASLLVMMVFWLLVSFVQFASNQADSLLAQSTSAAANYQQRIDRIEATAREEGRELSPGDAARIEGLRTRMEPLEKQTRWIEPYAKPVRFVELLVPKTGDIQKIIASLSKAPTLSQFLRGVSGSSDLGMRPAGFDEGEWRDLQSAGTAGEQAVRKVDRVQSLVSSLVVTVLLLLLAAWIFVRRDY